MVSLALLSPAGCGGPGEPGRGGDAAIDAAVLDLSSGVDAASPCGAGCSGATPHCDPRLGCVACTEDAHCPRGSVCRPLAGVPACVPGCADAAGCARPDGAGAIACCGGACADTASDPQHCGGCGTACALDHARPACAGGQCAVGSCDPGWADCDQRPGNGCETDLRSDVRNCTACGTTCTAAHATPGCADGCYLAGCDPGYADCDNTPVDGCEAVLASDKANCGSCGNACANPPHAQAACLGGACALAACAPGFADCNANPADGCEVAISADSSNCGACGNRCGPGLLCKNQSCTCAQCSFANARSSCVNLQCVMGACLDGWADCNHDPADGCELPVGRDPENCGGCGVVCPDKAPACVAGACVVGCLAGGRQPPAACDGGSDPETSAAYVLCAADCTSAYLAAAAGRRGGTFHAEQICQKLGYSRLGAFGGTCGKVCGYCNDVAAPSCSAPQDAPHFDGSGDAGKDQFGQVLALTVQWQCLK